MGFIAGIAVDRRQGVILSSNRLQEMRGASQLIDDVVDTATHGAGEHDGVEVIRPVSGEVWVSARTLEELARFLFDVREELVEKKRLQVSFAVIQEENPKDTPSKIEEALNHRKANPSGEDGRPGSPFFARCRVLPEFTPNLWRPGNDRGRDLVSLSADVRQRAAARYPIEMRDFARGQENAYAAFLKSDVDGLGQIQINAQKRWPELAHEFGLPEPYGAIRKFSELIENNVEQAVTEAIAAVNVPGKEKPYPIVQAGDDLWVVCRRESALEFAVECGKRFTALCQGQELVMNVAQNKAPTLSFGVLFAKVGFPLNRQVELSSELLKNAKDRRRKSGEQAGFLDYFWLDSAGSDGIAGARAKAAHLRDKQDGVREDDASTYRLYTRPWTLGETEEFHKASKCLAKFPARKLHQLPPILRMGREFTQAGIASWFASLAGGEKDEFLKAAGMLPERFRLNKLHFAAKANLPEGPWLNIPDEQNSFYTPIQELLELVELTRQGQD